MSIFYGPDEVEENRWTLGLDVRIQQDYGYLEFAFTDTELIFEPLSSEQLEIVFSQKKDIFLSWLTNFLNAYKWIGHNQKPGSEQLATRFGIINLEKSLSISNITVMAFFTLIDSVKHSTDKITIVISRLLYMAICRSNEKLTDAISENPNEKIMIYKEWAIPVDSAIYGAICVSMRTIAWLNVNDSEAHSYIKGVSNAILKSVRSAI